MADRLNSRRSNPAGYRWPRTGSAHHGNGRERHRLSARSRPPGHQSQGRRAGRGGRYCDPDEVDYKIPGNDDAIRSVTLLTRVVADAVAEGRMAAARRWRRRRGRGRARCWRRAAGRVERELLAGQPQSGEPEGAHAAAGDAEAVVAEQAAGQDAEAAAEATEAPVFMESDLAAF